MSDQRLGFTFHPELCIQCHACQTACETWNNLPSGISNRTVLSGFSGAYPDTKLHTLSVSCLHCSDPACAAICPAGALFIDDRGLVLIDKSQCTGCRLCLSVCPVEAPRFDSSGYMEKCTLCSVLPDGIIPPCSLTCPTGALSLSFMTQEAKTEEDRRTIARFTSLNE